VHASGNAYANSINFDFPGGEYRPGLIALVRPDGTAVTVAEDIAFPNGMVITGSTLIVAESYAARLTAFTIDPDGGLSDRRVWADLGEGAAPDGIGLDPNGDVWVADVPNQSCTLVREGGEVLRRVDTPLGCFSCAVGDGTLYMVVADYSDPAKMFSSQTGLLLAEDIG
jgi:sugar lactone lactonase YvrE